MYKILLVFSSVVYNDKTYCLYALVNKEDNEHLLCVAELNLEMKDFLEILDIKTTKEEYYNLMSDFGKMI